MDLTCNYEHMIMPLCSYHVDSRKKTATEKGQRNIGQQEKWETEKLATDNWATGKLGNEKMRHMKEMQHVLKNGQNGNQKFGQRKIGHR